MYEGLAVFGTLSGLLALILAAVSLRQSQQADPRGIRADFRKLESEWNLKYENLSALEKRLSKREERAARGNGAGTERWGGDRVPAFTSDEDVAAYARSIGRLT